MQKLIPAILTANVEDLRQKLDALKGVSQWMHIDIMDGEFVSNTSVALSECVLAQDFKLEIHLMVNHPERYFEECEAIGAKRVIFHAEAVDNLKATLENMQAYPFEKGVALNPETSSHILKGSEELIDSFLFMTIRPGFQGQEFIPSVLEKIRAFKIFFPHAFIGVDGGVDQDTLKEVFRSGVSYAIVGSGIWQTANPKETLKKLEAMIQ